MSTSYVEEKLGPKVVCIVGAGLGKAFLVTQDDLKTVPAGGNRYKAGNKYKTDTMITAMLGSRRNQHRAEFPVLDSLFPEKGETFDTRLNYVWTHFKEFAQIAAACHRTILGKTRGNLRTGVEYLRKTHSPSRVISVLLEWELKRLITMIYPQTDVHDLVSVTTTENEHGFLIDLLEEFDKDCATVTWISLNYDTVLEEILQERGKQWRYCFDDVIPGCGRSEVHRSKAEHIVVKPHGSLNVWFRSDWPKDITTVDLPETRGDVYSHMLGLACNRRKDVGQQHTFDNSIIRYPGREMLTTCEPSFIGVVEARGKADYYYEFRPWLVGYLPDKLQAELNTPGVFADQAHDLCKFNMAYAGQAISQARKLYVLGYSMPPEDEFVWNRLKAVPGEIKAKMEAEVVSGGDSGRIAKGLQDAGISISNDKVGDSLL
jgi:hypothetical protein